jgi:hypothetical protein
VKTMKVGVGGLSVTTYTHSKAITLARYRGCLLYVFEEGGNALPRAASADAKRRSRSILRNSIGSLKTLSRAIKPRLSSAWKESILQSAKTHDVKATFDVTSSSRIWHFTNSQQSYRKKNGAPPEIKDLALKLGQINYSLFDVIS